MNLDTDKPIVTIITIVFNNVKTIKNAINSVVSQDYQNIEHIVIDNNSNDGTFEAISEFKDKIALIVSEKDKGIYHALNKGLDLANGDIVGFLNSDDVLKKRNTISIIVENIISHNVDSVYGDLQYFSQKHPNKITRKWNAGKLEYLNFYQGWMPPHPTFYTYLKIYKKYGKFDINFKISSDYEMMLRLLFQEKISTKYIPKVLVKMQRGGVSNQNLKSMMLKTKEDFLIMKKYDFTVFTLINKMLRKASQFIYKN